MSWKIEKLKMGTFLCVLLNKRKEELSMKRFILDESRLLNIDEKDFKEKRKDYVCH